MQSALMNGYDASQRVPSVETQFDSCRMIENDLELCELIVMSALSHRRKYISPTS